MKLKKIYIKKMETIGLDTSAMHVEDYEEKSIISFTDERSGEVFIISMVFYKDDYNYEVVVRKKVNVIDRLNVLEKINKCNMIYSKLSFFLESNEIYGLRYYNKYEGDPDIFAINIVNALKILSANNIQ